MQEQGDTAGQRLTLHVLQRLQLASLDGYHIHVPPITMPACYYIYLIRKSLHADFKLGLSHHAQTVGLQQCICAKRSESAHQHQSSSDANNTRLAAQII